MNLAGNVAAPPLAAFETLLRARRLLARRPRGFERRALRPVGLSERVFALGELIGGGATRRLRRFNLADQRAPLLFEQARRIGQARALALGLFHARLHRLDLRGRAVVALAPGLAIGGDRREPPPRNLRVARARLRFRAHRSEEHTSELQSQSKLACRLL